MITSSAFFSVLLVAALAYGSWQLGHRLLRATH